jgi:hypothetical protein
LPPPLRPAVQRPRDRHGISRPARSSKSVQRDMPTVTLIMIGFPEFVPALSVGELSPNI